MASKKIEPVNPAVTTADTETKSTAERKTAGASGRFRKLACIRVGRKTNQCKY